MSDVLRKVVAGVALCVAVAVVGCEKSDPVSVSSPAAGPEVHFGTALGTVAEFDAKVVKSGKPALVDFGATWCPPCQQLKPILAKLEAEYAGKIDFYTVDVDKATALTAAHGVKGYPTLLLYHGGHRHGAPLVGFRPEAPLRQHLDALLAGH